jgi:DNA topoisomerase IA
MKKKAKINEIETKKQKKKKPKPYKESTKQKAGSLKK